MKRLPLLLFVPTLLSLALTSPAGAGQGMATVTVIHGLPHFTADIYVDGELLIDGFKPKQATKPLRMRAGTYEVEVRELGAPADSPPALADSVTFERGSNVSIVAHLDQAGQGTLSVLSNDFRRLPAGRALLVIRAVADAPPLEVDLDGDRVARMRPGDTKVLTLSPSTHPLSVSAGGETLVRGTDLMLREGTARIVYVIGSSDDGTLDLMLQSVRGLHTAPGGVLTGDGGLVATDNGTRDGVKSAFLTIVASIVAAILILVVGRAPATR